MAETRRLWLVGHPKELLRHLLQAKEKAQRRRKSNTAKEVSPLAGVGSPKTRAFSPASKKPRERPPRLGQIRSRARANVEGGSPRLPEPARLETIGRRTFKGRSDKRRLLPSSTTLVSGQGLEDPGGKAFACPPVDPTKGSFRRGKRLNRGCWLPLFPSIWPAGRAGVLRSAERGWRQIEAKKPLFPLRSRSFQGRARLGDRTRPLDARLAKGVPEWLYRPRTWLKGRTGLGGSLGQAGTGGRSFFGGGGSPSRP